ncbi:MAG: hypothetical protein AABO41_18470 [Acidobacteriota bacterium]
MKKQVKQLVVVVLSIVFAVSQIAAEQAVKGKQRRMKAAAPTCAPTGLVTCPPLPTMPPPVMSASIPFALPPHDTPTPEQARPFFDYYSWQEFIALNWPAAIESGTGLPVRGVPNTSSGVNMGSPGTRVWETWKADYELFRPIDPSTKQPGVPSPWPSYALSSSANPTCPASPCGPKGAKLLVMQSKMDSVLNGVNQAFTGPLIAQNNTYVRYEIRTNQSEYEYVANAPTPNPFNLPMYIRANLPTNANTPIDFSSTTPANGGSYGAMEVKAAWRELKPGEDDSRYYWVNAILVDNPGTSCRCAKMALVGLHIANKLSPFREWVWSTFEQVDNVPQVNPDPPSCAQTKPSGAYSFNNGSATNPDGYDYQPDPITPPIPNPASTPAVEVNRVQDITGCTKCINNMFQQFLVQQLGANTVWQYYQLVATQWPASQNQFQVGANYPYNCDCPFPASPTTSTNDPVSNLTMETYLQEYTSCMQCHYMAAQTDFSFILQEDAYPPSSSAAAALKSLKTTDPINKLRQFLRQNRAGHAQRMSAMKRARKK